MVKEVLALIMGQIAATKAPVKAVLLVGGFGQNTFLRDSVRQAVASHGIEVMQSPNAYASLFRHLFQRLKTSRWTAVVRGALMKGLASTNRSFARVNVSGRSARKHYGVDSHKSFNPAQHSQIADKR